MHFTDEQIGDILAFAQEGKSVIELAEMYKCSRKAIEDVITGQEIRRRFIETRRKAIIEEYQAGMEDIDLLADLFEVSISVIKKVLLQAGIYKKPEQREPSFIEREAENVLFVKQYKEGASFTALLERYGRKRTAMLAVLKAAGIDFAYQQKVRRREHLYRKARRRYIERYGEQEFSLTPCRYEIECESQDEAKDLSDEIWESISHSVFEKNLHFLVEGSTLIIQGEVTSSFQQMMLESYIEEE